MIMEKEQGQVLISLQVYKECIVAMQTLNDIKQITKGWKDGIWFNTDENGIEKYLKIDDDDAMIAIYSLVNK